MSQLFLWLERTMLIERAFGVLTYVSVVLLTYFLLRKETKYEDVKLLLNFNLFALAIMAFFFVPDESKDLYRWLSIASNWKNLSLKEFSDLYLFKSTTPVSYLLIFLCTKTEISGLLPMVCAVIFYSNIFYILKDVYHRFNPSNVSFSLSYLFFMVAGSFLEVISGVRCFVAISIVTRCIYSEFFCGKSVIKNIFFYICACLMHTSALPLFIFRCVFYIFYEKKEKVILSVIMVLILIILATTKTSKYIYNMFDVAYDYIFGKKYTYIWEYLIGVIQLITMIYTMKSLKRKDAKPSESFLKLEKFLKLFLTVNAILLFEYNLFHRFLLVSTILFIPYLCSIKNNVDSRKYATVLNRVWLLSILIFTIVCIRGNLCGYKYFKL